MLRELMILFAVLAAGVAAGIFSARLAADVPMLSGAVQAGAWKTWPDAGVADAMPYARLRYLEDAALPPSPVDRLELLAETDDEGRSLTTDCSYILSGRMLPVRYWILAVHVPDASHTATSSLQAADAIHEPDSRLVIRVSRRPQPGNWLRLPENGRVRLVLNLFGVSPLEREKILKTEPFSIRREKCS